jgi:tetratricopeptide (TPR) repeat protein
MVATSRNALAAMRAACVVAACLVGASFAAFPVVAAAQDDPYIRAMDFEQGGKYREAVVAFRAALTGANYLPAMLGLERSYAAIGWTDSMVAVIDSAIRTKPREATFRSVQLRTYQMLGRGAAARDAFEQWAHDFPREAGPYREYARMLIDAQQPHTADTVLQRAQRVLGGSRDFQMEIAQTRAALGLWELSAQAWRDAVHDASYLERAAIFALAPTPEVSRAGVRTALLALPVEPGGRQILASLELGWGSPRQAWSALRDLTPGDSVASGWRSFAERAEDAGAWLIARDALVSVIDWQMSTAVAVRAAEAALRGGDPASALAIAERAAAASPDSAAVGTAVALIEVRALAALGRAPDAARVGDAYARWLHPSQRDAIRREIAWAWVRAGDVAKARAALAVAGTEEEAVEVTGWLALYEGDLKTARTSLRSGGSTADAVMAMALLARTRVAEAPLVGRAFLDLARGDTAAAASGFETAAASVPDAASLMVSIAARLRAARGERGAAVALWQRVVERYPDSPEAAEANLDWARALRAAGDMARAIQRLEHLIITYPQSALVPQARRELDLARRAIPPSMVYSWE